MNFKCNKCQYETIYKSNYTRHCKSKKHLGQPTQVLPKVFSCEQCQYSTERKSNYTRHCKSKRHLTTVAPQVVKQTGNGSSIRACLLNSLKTAPKKVVTQKAPSFECLACNRKFRARVSCVAHMKDLDHHRNVRRKFPETVINPDTVSRLNLKMIHVYFRHNGEPINVKIPLKKCKPKPAPVQTVEIEELEVEETKPEKGINFKEVTESEINSVEPISKDELSEYAYFNKIPKLRETLLKTLNRCKVIGVVLADEGLAINYDTVETINDSIYAIKEILLDDKYLKTVLDVSWE